MITLALGWVLLLAVGGTIGLAIMRLVDVEIDDQPDRWIVAAWFGVTALGAVLLAASIVVALRPLVFVVIASALVAASLVLSATRAEWRLFVGAMRAWLLPAAALVCALAALFTRPVSLFDSGLYHLGIVEWLSRYGSVTGAALIHNRFGFGSEWFALEAPFNDGFLHGRTGALLGGLAVLLGTAHLLAAGARCARGFARPSDVFLLVSLVVVVLSLSSEVMLSPSPDVPTAFLTVEAVWLLVKAFEVDNAAARQWCVTGAAVFAAAALGTKLNALPVAVAVFVLALFLRSSLRRLTVIACVAVILVGPTLASNTVTSGCPLFPAGACLGSRSTVAASERDKAFDFIRDHARGTSEAPPDERPAVSWIWRDWLPAGGAIRPTLTFVAVAFVLISAAWLAFRHWRRASLETLAFFLMVGAVVVLSRRLPNVLTSVSALAALAALWKARTAGPRVAALVALVGIGTVLMTGPALRFALGYVGIALAAASVVVHERVTPRTGPARTFDSRYVPRLALCVGVLAAAVAVVYVPGFGSGLVRQREAGRVLVPPEVPEVVGRATVNDVVYTVAPLESQLCWASRVPCAPEELPDDRRFRNPDSGIAGGFAREP